MAIPKNRPVIGHDLKEVRQLLGLRVMDICFLLGISITAWTQITKNRAQEPVKPALGLLLRLLDEHPELSMIPEMPGATDVFNMMNEVAQINEKKFSVLVGAEGSGFSRWKRGSTRTGPYSQRLLYCIRQALLMKPKGEKVNFLDEWAKTVQAEATAREAPEAFKTGQWNSKEKTSKSKQSISVKEAFARKNAGKKKPVPGKNVGKGKKA